MPLMASLPVFGGSSCLSVRKSLLTSAFCCREVRSWGLFAVAALNWGRGAFGGKIRALTLSCRHDQPALSLLACVLAWKIIQKLSSFCF